MLIESDGDLLFDFAEDLGAGKTLVAMPIARVDVEWTARAYPGPVVFYPPGAVDLDKLHIVENRETTSSLAEESSRASGIAASVLDRHPLVAFPFELSWSALRRVGHSDHLELIRRLSEHVDTICLNFIRYAQCPIDSPDCLPGRAGQLNSNTMMAGALVYSPAERQARLMGGAAFTHSITRGLGLSIEAIEHDRFPRYGEVGKIVHHALMLYRDILEASSATSQFIQCLSLLEFLVDPEAYSDSEKIRKTIARYAAENSAEYQAIIGRILEITGKKDSSGRHVGYRTRIVHIGERIEEIVPDHTSRRDLFREVDGYARRMIDHMISHSDKTFDEYLKLRERLQPFVIAP